MLTETVKNLLAERKAQKNAKCVPVSNKAYEAFVMERHNVSAQMEARKQLLLVRIDKLNKVLTDLTFRFIIWDYGTFYSVQLFEGDENEGLPSVSIGEVNMNFADDNNLYILKPISRKRFKSLNGIEAYIMWYFNAHINPGLEKLSKSLDIVLEMNFVTHAEAQFRESRAVIFDSEMMMFWHKHKLLPTIKQIYNGKRYNRTFHAPKVIAALEQGKVIKENDNYIIYWTL